MKVAFLTQHFDLVLPPDQSSVGIWTVEVARHLATDQQVTIIARRPSRKDGPSDLDGSALRWIRCAPLRLWTEASRVWSRFRPEAMPMFAQRFYAIEYLVQAIAALRSIRPDLVHIHSFPQFAPAIRRALPDAAIVLHMHCDWLTDLDEKALARSLASVDLVVGCSDHVISAARARFAETGAGFSVVPNGVNVGERSSRERDGGKVLFVGRVSPEKGVHTLIEAWPQVAASCPHAHLELVGPAAETPREFLVDLSSDPDVRALARFYPAGRHRKGFYADALHAAIPKDLAPKVTFAGPESYRRLPDRYATASLVVCPSMSEAFGMCIIEALAAGTPVVATRAGGMSALVEGTGGGVLVDRNDPGALAGAILKLLRDPEHALRLGRRGARQVEKLYSWPRIASLTREVHQEAVARSAMRRREKGGALRRRQDRARMNARTVA